jgi:hypothetical protein
MARFEATAPEPLQVWASAPWYKFGTKANAALAITCRIKVTIESFSSKKFETPKRTAG